MTYKVTCFYNFTPPQGSGVAPRRPRGPPAPTPQRGGPGQAQRHAGERVHPDGAGASSFILSLSVKRICSHLLLLNDYENKAYGKCQNAVYSINTTIQLLCGKQLDLCSTALPTDVWRADQTRVQREARGQGAEKRRDKMHICLSSTAEISCSSGGHFQDALEKLPVLCLSTSSREWARLCPA